MKVAVWDTYVRRADGITMHFVIMVPETVQDATQVYGYGDDYLSSKPFEVEAVTTKQCRYCHMEIATPEMAQAIADKGYFILEMENCGA